MNSIPKIPTPVNEPVLSYAPGTPERAELKRTLKELSGRQLEIPLVVGGKDVDTGRTVDVVMPHCHRHVLAKAHQAGPAALPAASGAARGAGRDWCAGGCEQGGGGMAGCRLAWRAGRASACTRGRRPEEHR